MSEKPTQQHRQHFNLSEEGKQKLEELTARRYPGKQRRQSQLVEDLITEAFAKERGMSTVSTGVQEPEPGGLAVATQEALNLARRRASSMQAREVYPEHLLLALVEQGHDGTLKALNSLRMDDVPKIRNLIITMGAWRVAEELYKHGEVLKARVTGNNKGGLVVDVSGIRGFVPISQLLDFTDEEVAAGGDNPETGAKLLNMVGRELLLKIIELNPERKRLILSEHLVLHEWRQRRREELLEELKPGVDPWATVEQRYTPGQVVTGTITRIAPFGVFARIDDGVEGLIHLSELLSGMDPKTGLHLGQYVQLRILRLDTERRRLGLSLRQVDEPGPVVTRKPDPISRLLNRLHQVDEPVVTIKDVPFSELPLEESPATIEEATAPEAGEPAVHLPLSVESRECIDRAVSIAKRMHSLPVQPVHLLLSVLQNERIQNALAAWLPSPEVISNPTIIVGFTEDEQTRLSACPFCGRSVQPHWKHCVYCGKSLARVCPKCGTPRAEAEGVRFCYECGSPFE